MAGQQIKQINPVNRDHVHETQQGQHRHELALTDPNLHWILLQRLVFSDNML